MHKVSIIVPTYNRAKTLGRAIESILKQTYTDYEIIIVDDASTDNTREVVEQIEDERIRYIRLEQNQGAGHARNEGIRMSRYDYIAFLDSDDEWMPAKLELQMKKMTEAAEDVGLVYCRMRTEEQDTIWPPYEWADAVTLAGDLFPTLLWTSLIGTPAILVRKKCFESVGMFKETLQCIEDWELVLRIAREWRIEFVDEILVEIHLSENGVSANYGAFVLTRCYMVSKYRSEMIRLGLLQKVEKSILEVAERFGLLEETQQVLDMDFEL